MVFDVQISVVRDKNVLQLALASGVLLSFHTVRQYPVIFFYSVRHICGLELPVGPEILCLRQSTWAACPDKLSLLRRL